MAWRIDFTRKALRELEGFPRRIQERLLSRIEPLRENPRPRGAKKLALKGEDLYRIRSGDYRIIYTVHDRQILILVVRLGHRKEVYKKLGLLG